MKRGLALIFIFITGLSLFAGSVKAEQVVYESFDNIRIFIQNDVGYSPVTVTLSVPSQECLAGVYVGLSDTNLSKFSVTVNGIALSADKNSLLAKPTQAICSDTFTIKITASILVPTEDGADDRESPLYVKSVTIVLDNPYRVILSRLTNYLYIPPGADNTAQGFLLNKTELYLNQTYNLPEGALKFWLKWDGTKPLSILKNGSKTVLGINSNGELFVNSTSEGYVLQGVSIPAGVYVPIAIGWKAGYGYILLNSTILKLNWKGNFSFNRIGDVNQNTRSIIDEFMLYNSFVSEEYILHLQRQDSFSIRIGNKLVNVYPDGGTHLPTPLTISYYSQNNSLLNSTTWYGSYKIYTAPNGTYKIILSASGASSVYLVSALQGSIAFLSSDASGTIEPIYIVPSEPGILVVKNTEGKIIYADELKSSNDVIGVLGGSYYVSFTDENNITRAAGWFTFTGKGLTLLLSSNLQNVTGAYANAWYDNGTLKIEFVDGTGKTTAWNLTVEYYQGAKLINGFTIPETSKKYIATFIPPTGAEEAVVKISTDSGFSKTMTVYLAKEGTGLIPSQVFPWWLLMGLFGIGGLLIAPARYRFLSPLIATGILGFAELAGMFSTPAWLLGSLTGLALLSLIIYRPSSRG